jgi:glycosyltransferase involved in cell wall biosynthesis
MKIMVFDVPAISGGALSILEEYYHDAVHDNDKSKTWYFIVSLPELPETENIKVLRFSWIKKSWFHRLYFDQMIAPKLVEKYKADEILSLQNIIIPKVKLEQTLYVHQPLPFVDKKFKITENMLFWIYQNIIGRIILKSIKKANKIIVQTNWMKEACIKKTEVDPKKIKVIPPKINIVIKNHYKKTNNSLKTFFYPANASLYKNHKIILNSAFLLKEKGLNNYRILFTLKGNENKHIALIHRRTREYNLPIEFIGAITREQVFDYYTKSILIFPSYIETFGLPMLEAKLHNTPILASDCSFSHEILDGYEHVWFFGVEDAVELATLMQETVKHN